MGLEHKLLVAKSRMYLETNLGGRKTIKEEKLFESEILASKSA